MLRQFVIIVIRQCVNAESPPSPVCSANYLTKADWEDSERCATPWRTPAWRQTATELTGPSDVMLRTSADSPTTLFTVVPSSVGTRVREASRSPASDLQDNLTGGGGSAADGWQPTEQHGGRRQTGGIGAMGTERQRSVPDKRMAVATHWHCTRLRQIESVPPPNKNASRD